MLAYQCHNSQISQKEIHQTHEASDETHCNEVHNAAQVEAAREGPATSNACANWSLFNSSEGGVFALDHAEIDGKVDGKVDNSAIAVNTVFALPEMGRLHQPARSC